MAIDVYQRVTDAIVAAIEAGANDRWRMPWAVKASDGEPMPHNVETGKLYRGINVIMLWSAQKACGYRTAVWGTYRQWQDKGAQVRKGEVSTTIVFWKVLDRATKDDGTEDDTGRPRMMAKAYPVFNADQVDGYQPAPMDVTEEAERDASAEAWFGHLGANIRHGGSRAYYSPSSDHIQMPEFSAFVAPVHYYGTLAHECVHWTGHDKRTPRAFGKRFGDEAYAAEELVAELGAAFVCAMLGLDSEPRPDHAQYIQSWLRVLKGDKRAIFTAAGKAQAAVDWLQGRQPAEVAELDMAA